MSDVFVSYKAEDRRRVAPLVAALEADGLTVWWDTQIGGGTAWRQSIETELEAAKCVIVIWSKRSVGPEGSFVRDEASRAMERGTYLPVKFDAVRPPLGFGETQAIPLVGWKGDPDDARYRGAVGAVRAIMDRKAPPKITYRDRADGLSRRAMLVAGGSVMAAAAAAGGWLLFRNRQADVQSIAVLPFANLSGDPSQAYFSDGLAEELRNALSRLGRMKVVARTSSEAVRGDDARTAARKLAVANILTGSVRRSPTVIRVSAQLVDGSTGVERWSQSFDRPFGDVLAIQTNIAENVARALSIELRESAQSALTMGSTSNATAHDLLLQAAFGRTDDSEEGVHRTLDIVEGAIALDPNYAEAFATKAFLLNFAAGTFAKSPSEMLQGLARAEQAANRAIAIAPRLPIGHAALSTVMKNQIRFKPAFSELKRALALGGNDVITLRNQSVFLAQIGRSDEAGQVLSRIRPLDPLNPGTYEVEAQVHFLSRQFAAAVASANRSLKMAPTRIRVRSFLGNSLLLLGRYDDARGVFAKMPATDVHALMGLSVVAAMTGDRNQSDQLLAKIRKQFGDNASYQYAQVYAQRHQANHAIASLLKAVETRDPGLASIKSDPLLDPVRNDTRLGKIINELYFPS